MSKPALYGSPVLSNGIIPLGVKIKNKILTKVQFKILHHFGRLKSSSIYGRSFAMMARKFIGSYIYSIKIETSNRCNLKCQMCYVPGGYVELPIENIKKLFEEISDCGIRIEILGGEPLLHNNICDIVRMAKNIAKSPFISLYTNGTHATKELCLELKAAGLDAALVTLVSTKEEIHNRFTGVSGSWNKTITGVKNFTAAGIDTYTFTAVHKKNYSNIIDIHHFVRNKVKAHPLFYQYIPQKKDDTLEIDKQTWYPIKNYILKENPEHAKFVRDFYMLTGNACSGGNFVLTIKVDGSVQPCPFISDIPMGNIKNHSIWEIYKNRYKSKRLKEFKNIPNECKKCSYASVCGGGCRAGNEICNGSYYSSDRRCLGPYNGEMNKDLVMDKTPCFF